MGPKHRENEDNLGISEPDSPALRGSHGSLYLIADGVGGHQKGEVASSLAVDIIERAYFATRSSNPADNLVAAIGEANLRVHESAGLDGDDGPSMATTVVAAAVLDDQIIVANVGDSRAYVIEDRTIRQLSHDHSWVQDQIDRGRLTPEQARQSPRRNLITRALGLTQQVEAEVKTEVAISVPARLLLCSDGVHSVLEDQELAELVQESEPQSAVKRILALVDERRGRDDATLIVVQLNGVRSDQQPPSGRPRLFRRVRRLFRRARTSPPAPSPSRSMERGSLGEKGRIDREVGLCGRDCRGALPAPRTAPRIAQSPFSATKGRPSPWRPMERGRG